MTNVAVSGYLGRMGQAVVAAVTAADDMEIVCGIDPNVDAAAADVAFPCFTSVADALEAVEVDVLVDFTQPSAAADNLKAALSRGVDCVLGTTGIPLTQLETLAQDAPEGTSLFFAPNFTTGAVLMMQFARVAAPFFPQVEIVEMHHCNKKDAPSGTAIQTARLISEARKGCASEAPGSETEIEGCAGARGALVEGVPVHSMRSQGFVANQEVVFGSLGQTLTIRHESWDRDSYMPGVLLGIRASKDLCGLVVGLENLMEI